MQDKIDLVYLWVDGSDKDWIEKKRKALMAIDTISDSQPTAEARFVDNDELKYCPHGRPICISLSKKQLEKQFRRA